MGAAITDGEVFAVNVKDADGTSADFDDFAFTGRYFVWGCYNVFRHWLVVSVFGMIFSAKKSFSCQFSEEQPSAIGNIASAGDSQVKALAPIRVYGTINGVT